eukprot:COSAG01_NODE_523_length_15948_cov_161.993690_7_plen_84_part_00
MSRTGCHRQLSSCILLSLKICCALVALADTTAGVGLAAAHGPSLSLWELSHRISAVLVAAPLRVLELLLPLLRVCLFAIRLLT